MNNERKARSAPQRIDAVEGHPRHAGRTMKRFFKDLMQQKWKLLAVVLCLAAASVCSVLGPRVLGMATNQIFDGVTKAAASGTHFSVDLATMGTILFALAGLYLLGTLLNYIPQRILASVSQDLSLSLRKRISAKINRLPLRYFDTHKKGQILSRVTSDLERVADTLQETIANMITAVMTLIGAFIMILSISPALTAIALGTVVASMLVSIIIGSRTNRYHAANQAALGELNANIEEAFTGNSIIKAFNLKAEMTKQNDMLNEKLWKTSTKAQFITYVINPVVRLIGQFGYVLIAVRGAMAVISGALRIGDVQAAFQSPMTQRMASEILDFPLPLFSMSISSLSLLPSFLTPRTICKALWPPLSASMIFWMLSRSFPTRQMRRSFRGHREMWYLRTCAFPMTKTGRSWKIST